MLLDRDSSAVVCDADSAVVEQFDADGVAVAGERFVDRVVHDLVDEVVKSAFARGADVHARALAHCLETLEDGDLVGVVISLDGDVRPVLEIGDRTYVLELDALVVHVHSSRKIWPRMGHRSY